MPPKQAPNALMFIGTLNNPDTTTCEKYLELWHTRHNAAFVTGQIEKGKEGTVHLQYFVQFAKPGKRITALKAICPRSHFELVK